MKICCYIPFGLKLNTITELSIQVSHSSEPEHVRESELLPPQTPEASVADNSISSLPEHILNVSRHISEKPPEALATKNMQTSETNDTILKSLPSNSQNIIKENIESVTESTKTMSKDIACSAMYTTPNKVQHFESNDTISKPMPSKPQKVMEENIPSPFKRALFWSEPEIKKRHTEKNDIPYQESDQDLDLSEEDQINHPKHRTQSLESDENIPLKDICLQMLKQNTNVIIKYKGEYFPGMIKNIDNNTYEISTMVLSRGNTFWWPDTPDQIWYNRLAIMENIQNPKTVNNRGFFKVPEMEKYLPFIC
ncbi:hypothetical protein FQA39_LY14257 [Lamprigera yunnana]|nr:hypothetical protein FQA39_LY14257 [Lamprigera yunnana]